jgi:hypothetical protein
MDKNCPYTRNAGLLSEVGNGTVREHGPFQGSNAVFRRGAEMDLPPQKALSEPQKMEI